MSGGARYEFWTSAFSGASGDKVLQQRQGSIEALPREHVRRSLVNDCAIVVPIYKLPLLESEKCVLDRNLRTLSVWPVVFVLPRKLSRSWQKFYENMQLGRTIYLPDRFFASIHGYNELLLDIRFYLRFLAFKNILICQLDAVVVRDELRQWCDKGYSYVGAPWFAGYDVPTLPYQFLGVGNGGFSLRRVAHFIRLLAIPRAIRTLGGSPSLIEPTKWMFFLKKIRGPRVQEDVFWSLMKDNYPWFTIPIPGIALKFSFEVAPRYLFELNGNQLPFGAHAWEKYDKEFWIEQLPDLSGGAEIQDVGLKAQVKP